jgi:hypothetical protein
MFIKLHNLNYEFKTLTEKAQGRDHLGRPRRRWKETIERNLKNRV